MKKKEKIRQHGKHRVSGADKGAGVLLVLIICAMMLFGAVALAASGVFEPVAEPDALAGAEPLEFATKPPVLGRVLEMLVPSAHAEESGEAAQEITSETDLEALLDALAQQESEAEIDESKRVTVAADDLAINENLPDEWVNVLLMATDSRDIAKNNGRTDVMIVASVNPSTGEIKLSSFARDMYLTLPNGAGGNRINAAYSFGGPLLALKTVNETFELNCQYYAVVNFKSMAAIVDALGGVDIELQGLEYYYINYNVAVSEDYEGFAKSKARRVLTAADDGVSVHLDGLQAVSYARIRHLDNDLQRGSRQRILLQALLNKMMENITPSTLMSLAVTLVPNTSTNLDVPTILKLGTQFLAAGDFSLSEFSLPVENSWKYERIKDSDVITIDVAKNAKALHEYIYGEYIPAAAEETK
ncbi:MAG: LCP family protein [Clostridiales bacterium]|nr:LCP family protein [Clostridiales bacterium]MDY2834060.1 LCP family protein [Candidatus Aphodomonas sp.]